MIASYIFIGVILSGNVIIKIGNSRFFNEVILVKGEKKKKTSVYSKKDCSEDFGNKSSCLRFLKEQYRIKNYKIVSELGDIRCRNDKLESTRYNRSYCSLVVESYIHQQDWNMALSTYRKFCKIENFTERDIGRAKTCFQILVKIEKDSEAYIRMFINTCSFLKEDYCLIGLNRKISFSKTYAFGKIFKRLKYICKDVKGDCEVLTKLERSFEKYSDIGFTDRSLFKLRSIFNREAYILFALNLLQKNDLAVFKKKENLYCASENNRSKKNYKVSCN
ncbi:hypothetical protein [Halobacteriovorax sp. HLS]|uniref:hypothetical protein n=1 Tax=Halobacteriovorax sp. HLS TaxID=2234000 RepID=UPI000FDCA4FF|nr:hypothetical protein [Halobacteriovorax sp. HLS]